MVIRPSARSLRNSLLCVCLLAGSYLESRAQTVPSAEGPSHGLWVGVEVSNFNPDYLCSSNLPFSCPGDLWGLGGTADYGLATRLSVAGEARWLEWNGGAGETEASYLVGPQYRLWERNKFAIHGNVLLGMARLSVPDATGSWFAYAPGAEASYRPSRHLESFVSWQYQFWPSFAGGATVSKTGQVIEHNHGLTPNGLSWGMRWRLR